MNQQVEFSSDDSRWTKMRPNDMPSGTSQSIKEQTGSLACNSVPVVATSDDYKPANGQKSSNRIFERELKQHRELDRNIILS